MNKRTEKKYNIILRTREQNKKKYVTEITF